MSNYEVEAKVLESSLSALKKKEQAIKEERQKIIAQLNEVRAAQKGAKNSAKEEMETIQKIAVEFVPDQYHWNRSMFIFSIGKLQEFVFVVLSKTMSSWEINYYNSDGKIKVQDGQVFHRGVYIYLPNGNMGHPTPTLRGEKFKVIEEGVIRKQIAEFVLKHTNEAIEGAHNEVSNLEESRSYYLDRLNGVPRPPAPTPPPRVFTPTFEDGDSEDPDWND